MLRPHLLPSNCQAVVALVLLTSAVAHAGNTWDGGGADDNWNTAANWNPDGIPAYGTATFSGSIRTTPVLDGNYNMNQVIWTNTSSTWTFGNSGGAVLFLFDNGGVQAKVESYSTNALVTINAPITFAANNASPPNPFGEINAVYGDLTFGTGTLTVNGSSVNGIKLFGGGHTVTFNNTVSASGKWFGITTGGTGNTINLGGSFTSSDFYVMNDGTLNLNSGGSLTTSVRLGGDFGNTGNQNQTKSGTFNLTVAAGGQTFSGVINSVTGNTSGTLAVNSQNTSGVNTLSGHIALDSALKITQTAGGTLNITQTKGVDNTTGTDIKGNTLTLTPASGGTIVHSGTIYNSTGSGSVTMNGLGTLAVSGNNSFGGLTTISAGALNIQHANALGTTATGTTVAGGAELQIQGNITSAAEPLTLNGTGISSGGALHNISGTNAFTGAITLGSASRINCDSGILTLNSASAISGATLGLTVGGAGAVSISSVIGTTSGSVTKDGSGILALTGANTFSGPLSVQSGTLAISTINNSTTPGPLGNSILAVTLGSSGATGTLEYAGNTATSTKLFTLATSGTGAFQVDISGQILTLSGQIVGSGALIKSGAGTLTLSAANTFSGALSVQAGTLAIPTINNASANGTLGNSANAVTLGASGATGTLEYTGTTASSTKPFTLATSGIGAFQIDSSGQTLTLSGGIAGSGNLTKSGAGTLSLSTANGYTGTTTVQSGGALRISNASALGASGVGQGTTVNSGGQLQTSGTLAVSEPLTLNGTGLASDGALLITANGPTFSGPVTLGSTGVRVQNNGAATTFSGGITGSGFDLAIGGTAGWAVNTQPINIGSGTLTKDGGSATVLRLDTANTIGAVALNSGVLNIGNAACLGSGVLGVGSGVGTPADNGGLLAVGSLGLLTVNNNINLALGAICGLGPAGSTTLELAGVISGSGSMKRNRPGATGAGIAMLSGANSFTGGLVHQSDALVLNNRLALGAGTYTLGDPAVSPPSAVNISANIPLTAGNAVTNSVLVNRNFTLSGPQDLEFSGPVTLAATPTITDNSSGVATFSGIISGAGFGITKSGAGTLRLSGNNTYTGDTTVSAGILRLGAAGVIPDGSGKGNLSLASTLDLNTFSETVNGLSGAGIVDTLAGGSLVFTVGNNDQTSSFTGIIINTAGSLALTKIGIGTLTLSGNNTYTGNTTVSAGVLTLSGSGSISNTPVILVATSGTLDATSRSDASLTLASGQTLKGNGTVKGTTVITAGSTLAPGSSVGALTNLGPVILQGGGTNVVEVIDATNSPGVGFDLLSVTGDLGVQATSGNTFTLKLVSFNGSGAGGNVTNFDNNTNYSWTVASVSGSVTNFDTNAFNLDTSSFSNDLAGGQFLVQTGSLVIVFTNNHSPTAPNATFSRAKGVSLKIPISDLAATWADPDGDPTSLLAVDATSTNGATITTNSTFIFYDNTNDVADTFTYTIRDIRSYRPGDTIRTAVVTCFINVTNAYGTVQAVTPGPTSATVDFAGVPGYAYDIQRSTNLVDWATLLTTNTPPAGLFQFVDDFTDIGGPPSQAYYRLKQN